MAIYQYFSAPGGTLIPQPDDTEIRDELPGYKTANSGWPSCSSSDLLAAPVVPRPLADRGDKWPPNASTHQTSTRMSSVGRFGGSSAAGWPVHVELDAVRSEVNFRIRLIRNHIYFRRFCSSSDCVKGQCASS
jgi:hypothetical protein